MNVGDHVSILAPSILQCGLLLKQGFSLPDGPVCFQVNNSQEIILYFTENTVLITEVQDMWEYGQRNIEEGVIIMSQFPNKSILAATDFSEYSKVALDICLGASRCM